MLVAESPLCTDGDQGFNDAILALRKGLPGARLRLITNGTCIPTGNWLSEIDEVSVSLDDECAESYLSHKGKDLFETVWANIRALLL